MLSGSGTVSFYITFYPSGTACSCTPYSFIMFPLPCFLVWPLCLICLISIYTLKSKSTMADIEVHFPLHLAGSSFGMGKVGCLEEELSYPEDVDSSSASK